MPIRSAARIAGRFADGRLKERMLVRGEDDMARLAQAFNRELFQTLVHIALASLWVLPVIAAGTTTRVAFLIASAGSERQVVAVVDEIEEVLSQQLQLDVARREGKAGGRWVLLDYGHFVVHVQHEEERVFYALAVSSLSIIVSVIHGLAMR